MIDFMKGEENFNHKDFNQKDLKVEGNFNQEDFTACTLKEGGECDMHFRQSNESTNI